MNAKDAKGKVKSINAKDAKVREVTQRRTRNALQYSLDGCLEECADMMKSMNTEDTEHAEEQYNKNSGLKRCP
jgi:hypothetical protein